MRIVQVLPELNAGGVERGTVEFARFLVEQGHESIVISAGGRQVALLEQEGSRHIAFPVHKKSLWSFTKVRSLRRLLDSIDADIVHVRSRMPAWLVWLAIGRRPRARRPGLVSTFHGLYSVNGYSAIMGCGDRVIAISECVRDYIVGNYPKVSPAKITLVHRGVDRRLFPADFQVNAEWREAFFSQYPELANKPLLLMPGRLSRWKGQTEFIDLMASLKADGIDCHGLIVGGPSPGKEEYEQELKQRVAAEGLSEMITFLGHRNDIANLYGISRLVLNLSQHPEPFGRTVIEALAVGTPVVAFNSGGPAESLAACFPEGLVADGDMSTLKAKVTELLASTPAVQLSEEFTLATQAGKTVQVYQQVLAGRGDVV
ncbi:glycosyltransferase family 4 protein [Halioxenophilus sp. WMMB6]|uniref:glycosyltransferase family 4 protein n=1 Tax=Halioxenophilus sp. WMMB6 TaxID=3073815 RepID=UPI00295F0515|nr:glycosyltransferase family 4 protein [Halioxenophilus sp. WMMB6]